MDQQQMLESIKVISKKTSEGDIAIVEFDLVGEKVNKWSTPVMLRFKQVVTELKSSSVGSVGHFARSASKRSAALLDSSTNCAASGSNSDHEINGSFAHRDPSFSARRITAGATPAHCSVAAATPI